MSPTPDCEHTGHVACWVEVYAGDHGFLRAQLSIALRVLRTSWQIRRYEDKRDGRIFGLAVGPVEMIVERKGPPPVTRRDAQQSGVLLCYYRPGGTNGSRIR